MLIVELFLGLVLTVGVLELVVELVLGLVLGGDILGLVVGLELEYFEEGPCSTELALDDAILEHV